METYIPVSEFFRFSGAADPNDPNTVNAYLDAGTDAGDFGGLVAVGSQEEGQLLGLALHGMVINFGETVSGVLRTVTDANRGTVVYRGQNNVNQPVYFIREGGYADYLRISSDNTSNVMIGLQTATVDPDTASTVREGVVTTEVLDVVLDWEHIEYTAPVDTSNQK